MSNNDWTLSIVMIIPAALQDKANKLACALGHDVLPGNTFSVPLSADGSEPATHYGCRTAAQQNFVDLLTAAGQGSLPDVPWADFELTEADIPAVLSALIIDVKPASEAQGHFEAVIEARGLVRMGISINKEEGEGGE
jgi:hypothetical protein